MSERDGNELVCQVGVEYQPAEHRYQTMEYRRCGKSGLLLPALSFGLWHNFGQESSFQTMRALCRTAFDVGITHFDLANNYGPPPGSAEVNFGRLLREDFQELPLYSHDKRRSN